MRCGELSSVRDRSDVLKGRKRSSFRRHGTSGVLQWDREGALLDRSVHLGCRDDVFEFGWRPEQRGSYEQLRRASVISLIDVSRSSINVDAYGRDVKHSPWIKEGMMRPVDRFSIDS